MNKIEEHISQLYDSLSDGESQPISEESVKKAIRYIDDFHLSDNGSLLIIVSALNLLNAAVKKDNLKSTLYYSYIKSNVSKVAEFFLSNQNIFQSCSVYYDKNCKCFYFDIMGVIFSFHQVKESKPIVSIAANNIPIEWPGIRLQLIAQNIFEYAVETYDERKDENRETTNNSKLPISSSLIPCPDCGHLLSTSAKFCPNCGFDLSDDSGIAIDISKGDQVQLEVNGVLKVGIVQRKGKTFLDLKQMDDSIYRVKYSAITSILLTPHEVVDKSILSVQIIDLIYKILELEDINIDDITESNATIRDCSTGRVNAISDGGRSITCIAPIGFSKKNNKIGDRLFFIGNSVKDVFFLSIVEMTYQELCNRLLSAIRKIDTNQRLIQHVNAIVSYFRIISKKSESRAILRQIKDKVKLATPQEQENEDSQILSGDNINNTTVKASGGSELFVTESEQLKIAGPTVVGSVNLESISGWKPEKPKFKLSIIKTAKSNNILVNDLPIIPESECRQIEKELDSLIREGKREDCLAKSYEVITTKKPTPKYLRSYLDRIVNTEIALDHTEQAKTILAVLIAFSESQKDTKPNNLSHLYISLARLFVRSGNINEASLALDWAEYIFPKNKKVVSNLRQSLKTSQSDNVNVPEDNQTQDEISTSQDVAVSRMLIQDVEQYAKTQATLEGEESSSPLELFNMAEVAGSDTTKSFEFRAQMFLDAAAAYLNANLSSKTEFKLAVAHYARMKGNSLVAKISESVQQYPDSQSHLIAECDSARSYYLEALGLYNDLAQKRYLQELLLKYLKIEDLASQIEGGKTPDPEWYKGTLKAKMRNCLADDNIESQKVLYRACIAIGSTVERAWNTLANDADGTQPFYNKLGVVNFRSNAYDIINSMEKTSVSIDLPPGEFLRKVFENRQLRIKDLKKCIDDCLSWDFSPFDISTFEEKWRLIEEYKELMTTTDKLALDSINEVINILKPYAGRKDNERYRNLVSSQQILIRSRRIITETTTYYGRILFFHLQEKWLKEISRQIDEKDASALPQLNILPEPRYIKLNDDGLGVIDFIVTNNGDSTAQSFVVNATINGKEYVVIHEEDLSAGDSCGECIESNDFSQLESVDVLFKLTAKYQGRDLPTLETEAIYEQESGDVLTDIPWTIKNTPKETIFKGRESKLNTLISHYLSEERYMTYILYGLTRTGKTSILDYLCDRIEGKHIKEDKTKIIKAFKWSFDEKEFKNIKRSDLWANLLETNIYDKLTDELANAVDAAYHNEQGLPPADKLSQSDLDIIIDALNGCNIIPLIAIDEFSYIRKIIEEELLDTTFLKKLREISYSGRACFLYAGTYDIKDIPKEYGLTGEMNNTYGMPINEIEEEYANELIDVCPNLIFDDNAKSLIRALSGCVPYWIQWICLNCGKYAIAQKCRHLGLRDINHVVGVMTGEIQPGKKDTWQAIDEINFYNNQIDPNNIAEHQLISSISFIIKESTHNERGVSMDELNRLWDKYNVDEAIRKNMVHALTELEKRKIIKQFTDETREVYRLNVDLFRRWWFAHHRDLEREFKL